MLAGGQTPWEGDVPLASGFGIRTQTPGASGGEVAADPSRFGGYPAGIRVNRCFRSFR